MSTLLGNAAARLAVRSGFRSLVHLGFWAAIALSAVVPKPALALPSFAIQTGQPCAACHIGAFGPQLTPYGRDFKLHGYTANDGQNHGLPIALTTQTSFTHTLQPQPGGAAPGFKPITCNASPREPPRPARSSLPMSKAKIVSPHLFGW